MSTLVNHHCEEMIARHVKVAEQNGDTTRIAREVKDASEARETGETPRKEIRPPESE